MTTATIQTGAIDKYAQDGVNISVGDTFSAFVGSICRESYGNSPCVQVTDLSRGAFRGPRGFSLQNLPEGYMLTGAMDGIGTKTVLIDAAGNHLLAANDVIAMTAMDITRYGGIPLVFMNIFDVRSLGEPGSDTLARCRDIMTGLGRVAREQDYVLLTGETAELGVCVGSENPAASVMFNWGGAMIGAYHPDKMILGDTLAPGQVIIALADTFRSNGISSVRKALRERYGEEWWESSDERAQPDVIQCATPSVQYDRFLNRLHGWFSPETGYKPLVRMHGIVHLSGGAFESKLGHDLLAPHGLSAKLNTLFKPPLIMRQCAHWRGLSSEECYRTLNGGQGALVIVDPAEVGAFLGYARDARIDAQVAGEILPQQKYRVLLRSTFDDQWIPYD
ncbi:MAG: AIR synthase related protein [Candidatus Moraniibacteriota bacterium]